jgi:catechol 2,3-dioxygenase
MAQRRHRADRSMQPAQFITNRGGGLQRGTRPPATAQFTPASTTPAHTLCSHCALIFSRLLRICDVVHRAFHALEFKRDRRTEMIHPDRIGHVVIKVRDLERSRRFYTEVLGLELMKELPEAKMIFLASNRRDHHELALAEVGQRASAPNPNDIGLSHFAFRLKNMDDLRAAYRELKEHDVPISFTVNHGMTQSIYFLDPDGNQLEVYVDNPLEEIAKMSDPYSGLEKLDFARGEPSMRDFLGC